jgi:intergrase/recombinase
MRVRSVSQKRGNLMRTRSERIDLVHNVVADTVKTFSIRKFRGPQWDITHMPDLIGRFIKIAMLSNMVNERHYPQMVADGLKFYTRHLESVLTELVRLQSAEVVKSDIQDALQ